MATKKENKRHVVRRLRRALNLAEVPPQHTNGKLIRAGWGTGAGLRDVDARDGSDDPYDAGTTFYFYNDDDGCCEMGCYWCPFVIDADEGEGWTYNAANDSDPPKLGDLLAA